MGSLVGSNVEPRPHAEVWGLSSLARHKRSIWTPSRIADNLNKDGTKQIQQGGRMCRHPYKGYALYIVPSFVLLLLVCGCHIKLVSDYDDDFVKAATSVE